METFYSKLTQRKNNSHLDPPSVDELGWISIYANLLYLGVQQDNDFVRRLSRFQDWRDKLNKMTALTESLYLEIEKEFIPLWDECQQIVSLSEKDILKYFDVRVDD